MVVLLRSRYTADALDADLAKRLGECTDLQMKNLFMVWIFLRVGKRLTSEKTAAINQDLSTLGQEILCVRSKVIRHFKEAVA